MLETRRKIDAPDLMIAGAVGLIFLAGFVVYMLKLHPVAVFMDTLRFLGYYDDSISGRHSIWSTWNQGQHRGILPQAVVYLNARYFGLSVFGCTALSGAFIGLTGFAICLEIARSGVSRVMLAALSVLTFAALFSLSNWELYSVDVGVALFAKNLSFVLFWILLDRALRRGSRVAFALCIVTAPLIVLLVAFGWSFAFVGASSFVALTAAWKTPGMRRSVLIFAALLVSIVLYVVLGAIFPTARLVPETPATAANFLHLIYGTVLAVASVLVGRESVEVYGVPFALLAVAGVAMLAAAAYAVLGNLAKRRHDSIVANGLIVYALLDAASVAIARGMIDPRQAMAPRYFEDLSLLIIGIVWSIALLARDVRMPVRKSAVTLAAVLSVLFLLGQSATAADEWRKAPYRHESFAKMAAVTMSGPTTLADARLLQQPLDSAVRASAIQKRYGLGPFRRIPCAAGPIISGDGWYANDDGQGTWMGASSSVTIRNCSSEVRVRAYMPETFTARSATLAVDGAQAKTVNIRPGTVADIDLPTTTTSQYVTVRISVDQTTIPAKAFPGSQDTRELGLLVSSVRSEK